VNQDGSDRRPRPLPPLLSSCQGPTPKRNIGQLKAAVVTLRIRIISSISVRVGSRKDFSWSLLCCATPSDHQRFSSLVLQCGQRRNVAWYTEMIGRRSGLPLPGRTMEVGSAATCFMGYSRIAGRRAGGSAVMARAHLLACFRHWTGSPHPEPEHRAHRGPSPSAATMASALQPPGPSEFPFTRRANKP
jgi:hypothetical protein